MITLKSPQEIKHLQKAGKILADVLEQVRKKVKPGVRALELDELAEELILKNKCKPSFKNYKSKKMKKPFPATLCVSVNNEIVHALPGYEKVLNLGDIVGIDCGLWYFKGEKPLCMDMAITLGIGQIPDNVKKLINVAYKALNIAIAKCKPNNYVADISRAIQKFVEAQGFSVIRQLVGHGVGYAVHEDPSIPNFWPWRDKKGNIKKNDFGPKLKQGMCLALEPMISAGNWKVKTGKDGFASVISDGSLGAHFEHSVVVTKGRPLILTV